MKLILALALAISAVAQVRGPQIGWILEGTRARAVDGIPGAAAMGPAAEVEIIQMAASEDIVLALAAETREALWISPSGVERVQGARSGVEIMALSPRGSAAVLLSERRVQVIHARRVTWEADLAFLEETPRALAVSDDGEVLLAAAGDAVYKITAGGVERMPAAARAIGFLFGSRDALIATETQVLILRDAGLGVVYEGLKRPVGIGAVAGNRRVVVADAGLRAVVAINLADGEAHVAECDFEAEMLDRVSASVFRLTAAPVRIFDAARAEVFIVPPSPKEVEQ